LLLLGEVEYALLVEMLQLSNLLVLLLQNLKDFLALSLKIFPLLLYLPVNKLVYGLLVEICQIALVFLPCLPKY
jgi:hypothetical protein